jgi:hypothetical protein
MAQNVIRAGDVEQLILDGREFDVQGDAGVILRLSEYSTEVLPTGNGKPRFKRMRVLPGINDVTILVDETRGDIEFIKDIVKRGETVKCTITTAQLETYEGDVFPVIGDDFGKNLSDGTASLGLAGESIEKL